LSYRPTAFSQHVAGRTVRSVTRNLAAPTVDKSGPVGNPNLGDKPPEVASQFLRGRSNSRAGRPCHVAWASRPCFQGGGHSKTEMRPPPELPVNEGHHRLSRDEGWDLGGHLRGRQDTTETIFPSSSKKRLTGIILGAQRRRTP